MKLILAAALLALAFTTGFTCSKNTPPAETTTTAPTPEAAPAAPEAAPTEGQPAAAPTEAAPAAPAGGETH